jgi:AGZA family xanthine/uracil permease-like MFS transporter
MGLNAFFTYTVCFGLGFSWQQTLCMVFLCGLINIFITVTKIRKMIIQAIPPMLQHAISGGIGLFVAYVGMLNVGLITFTPGDAKAAGKGLATAATPGLATLDKPVLWVFLIGLLITVIFTVLNVKGGMLLAIVLTTLIGIPFGVTTMANSVSIGDTFSQLPQTFGVIFTADGFPALFSDVSKLPLVLITIFAFSMSDTFDTIGTFIGTGRRTGIFSEQDEKDMENGHGFSSKMDRALFADSIATSVGAIFGTSNTTTFVESAAGIGAGGRTGLTSVVVAICFVLSMFFAPIISAVPSAATAGVLVVVGCMMAASLKEINWEDITEAIPAFFATAFMAFAYSISYGIAAGFITYCIVMTCKKKAKQVHPIIWTVAILFIIDLAFLAVL